MRFAKMHGIGNDYVYVDAFHERVDDPASLARAVADRHTGVGGDGLILIAPPSDRSAADVRMRMFNADGSESEMCGNGVRCVAKFAIDRELSDRQPLRVETGRGVLAIRWERGDDGRVASATVEMGEPILSCGRIPAVIPGVGADEQVIRRKVDDAFFGDIDRRQLDAAGVERAITLVSMGNPHVIVQCASVADVPLASVGPVIERHPYFPRRINAHFVEVLSRSEVIMRTWERGSGITLACGTGASAVCVACVLEGRTDQEILAHLPGGDLRLAWAGGASTVHMTGPATDVFDGVLAPGLLRTAGIEALVAGVSR